MECSAPSCDRYNSKRKRENMSLGSPLMSTWWIRLGIQYPRLHGPCCTVRPTVTGSDQSHYSCGGDVLHRHDDPSPLLSVPNHLRCSPHVHISRFQIFLYILYPCFWLSTSTAFAFDVAMHRQPVSADSCCVPKPSRPFSLDFVTCCFCLLESTSNISVPESL